ncbi:MAG: metallophosphoesterase [Acidobacteria bacterium]|nr:metallophosphoesterase [Acidobacteriota bacterium]
MVMMQGRRRAITRLLLCVLVLLMAFGTFAFAQGKRYHSSSAWSFGLMADTQWTVSDDPEGVNPEYVSAALAGVIQEKLIDHNVKFVIQVGDLTDRAGDAGMETRNTVAQPLYDAGMGYFTLRGNHETYGYLYSRDPEWNVNVPGYIAAFPQTQGLIHTFGATNFSKPSDIMTGVDILDGLSYSFDYGTQGNNARFVIVDVEATSFIHSVVDEDSAYNPAYGEGWYYLGWIVYRATATVPGGSIPDGAWFRIASNGRPSTNFYGFDQTWPFDEWIKKDKYDIANTEFWPGMQQEWIDDRLDVNTRGTEHAFVLSHRGLMGANHADGFFGSSPASKAATQDVFYASLAANGVRYMLSGHDHLHNRAIVASPDGENQVQQIIHMAGSTKFYGPASLDGFSNTKGRETQLSQELYKVGYYVYTIDGPRVSVDYYSDTGPGFQDMEDYPYGDDSVPERLYLPEITFAKKESYGYSTNGQQFLIAQGAAYTAVQDSFGSTTARILSGTNNSTAMDQTPTVIDDNDTPDDPEDDIILSAPRPFTKAVNTGWVSNPDPYTFKSDIVSLWGMSDLGSSGQTDTYVLSISFDMSKDLYLKGGAVGIAALNASNNWVNAVDLNFGGTKNFVLGPYQSTYTLGTYGIDYTTRTAWAVVNYDADFVVMNGLDGVVRRVWRMR